MCINLFFAQVWFGFICFLIKSNVFQKLIPINLMCIVMFLAQKWLHCSFVCISTVEGSFNAYLNKSCGFFFKHYLHLKGYSLLKLWWVVYFYISILRNDCLLCGLNSWNPITSRFEYINCTINAISYSCSYLIFNELPFKLCVFMWNIILILKHLILCQLFLSHLGFYDWNCWDVANPISCHCNATIM